MGRFVPYGASAGRSFTAGRFKDSSEPGWTLPSRNDSSGTGSASLAHEIKQPIAATQIDAKVCLRALTEDRVNLKLARQAASRLLNEAIMADKITKRTTALYKKDAMRRERVNVNEMIREMALLLQQEASASAVSIRPMIADGIPEIMADRVFDSFITTKPHGTGMGLAISRSDRGSAWRPLVSRRQQRTGRDVFLHIAWRRGTPTIDRQRPMTVSDGL